MHAVLQSQTRNQGLPVLRRGAAATQAIPPGTLLEAALDCLRSGLSILPIDWRDKHPAGWLLPRDIDGKATFKPYQAAIADEPTARRWFAGAAVKSLAVIGGAVSGGLLILDFDVPRFYAAWKQQVGNLAEGLPVQQTGGGGYQVFLRCADPGHNTKLAWAPDEHEESGRTIAIETRAEGGYAVVPPSIHPTGNPYVMLVGSLTQIPTIPQAQAEALVAAARKLDERPRTRQEEDRLEREARAAHQKRRRQEGASVIDEFNRRHAIEALLEQHGYRKGGGGRYIRPGGRSGSVTLREGRSCHWSSNDPLNDGRVRSGMGVHDAFDVYAWYEHGGDVRAAVKAAAQRLGMTTRMGMTTSHAITDPDFLTDYGNAERLIQREGQDLRYHQARGEWLVWDGQRWGVDASGEAYRRAKKSARSWWAELGVTEDPIQRKRLYAHARHSETASGIEAALKLARSEPGITVSADDLDADPWLFNVRNGTLDLRTGQLRGHARQDRLTRLSPVAYDPQAACPIWTRFLQRIMAGHQGLIDYLQRIAGLALCGDISVQELFLFHGGGANGKSVFVETLLGILGDYGGMAPESLLTLRSHDEHPTEIADLCGRRLVIASETEEGAKLRVQLVKRLTGDARLKARFMRQDFFEFDRTHKLILVTNNRPVIRESTHAIWRRIRLIPFAVTIPPEEQDPKLIEKLKAEWPGILRWMVEGCLAWQKEGMQTPMEVDSATSSYQAESDPLADYLAERCSRAPEDRVTRQALFADYAEWCSRTGERQPLDRNALFERVRKVQGVSEAQWRTDSHSTPLRGFRGLGLTYLGEASEEIPFLAA